MSKHSTREEYNAYMRVYMLRRYHERRAKLIAALGGKCRQCGTSENLQFDHTDRASKIYELAKRMHTASAEDVAKEIGKTQLLCAPCHALKSTLERGQQPAAHGSITMYTHHRCRCEPCRAEARRAGREWREKKRQRNVKPAFSPFKR